MTVIEVQAPLWQRPVLLTLHLGVNLTPEQGRMTPWLFLNVLLTDSLVRVLWMVVLLAELVPLTVAPNSYIMAQDLVERLPTPIPQIPPKLLPTLMLPARLGPNLIIEVMLPVDVFRPGTKEGLAKLPVPVMTTPGPQPRLPRARMNRAVLLTQELYRTVLGLVRPRVRIREDRLAVPESQLILVIILRLQLGVNRPM